MTDERFPGDGQCFVCGRKVPLNMLLCGMHWRAVPALEKRAVQAAWAAWQDGEITLGELRAAQEAAIEQLGGRT